MLMLSNNVLFNSKFIDALVKISKCIFKDIKLTIMIAKTIKKIQDESEIIFPIRNELLNAYGVTSEGNTISFADPEKAQEFNDKIVKLAESEFEIPLDTKIKASDEMSGILDASDILALDPILTY